jgi:hypothetical protein
MSDDLLRREHTVGPCRHCGGAHVFVLAVRRRERAEPLFGGPGAALEPAGGDIAAGFRCPATGRPLVIPNPPDGEIVGLWEEAMLPSPGATPPAAADELAAWVKASREGALVFCRTMMTTAAASIPAYFAVLKYLGAERIAESALSRAAAGPPLLFLLAALVFAAAQRPRYAEVTPSAFEAFRRERLRALDRQMTVGLALFGLATLGAIGLGAALLAG